MLHTVPNPNNEIEDAACSCPNKNQGVRACEERRETETERGGGGHGGDTYCSSSASFFCSCATAVFFFLYFRHALTPQSAIQSG